MITQLDHVGIAIKDLDQSLCLYRDVLGLPVKEIEVFEDLGVRIAFLPLSEVLVELLAPLGEFGNIAKFLKARGEGVHHIALRVDDMEKTMKEISSLGVRFREEQPRSGGMGSMIIFLHPEDTGGLLVELVERK